MRLRRLARTLLVCACASLALAEGRFGVRLELPYAFTAYIETVMWSALSIELVSGVELASASASSYQASGVSVTPYSGLFYYADRWWLGIEFRADIPSSFKPSFQGALSVGGRF